MLKHLFKLIFISSILLVSLSFVKIDNINQDKLNIENKLIKFNVTNKEDSEIIGNITIEKLNINMPLYDINSDRNNIEENITILRESVPPDKENSIIFIAAHSGTGPIAFFKDLDKLEVNDEIIIEYKNKIYKYIVKNYWEEKKNGYINVNKEKENQLILTTCSPNKDNYQLVINCIRKES